MGRWGSGRWENELWNAGTIGQWTTGQRDKETMGQWTIGLGPLTVGHGEHGNGRTSQGDNAQWDFGKLGEWDKGAVGQWNIGQGALWTGEQWTRGQCHIGKWDNGTIGAWDHRKWDNGPVSNETMDIGTVDTEQLADACLSVWQT